MHGTNRQQLKWRSDCTWKSPTLLVVTALMWAWSDEQKVGDRFSTARSIALQMFPQTQRVANSYQAFMKLLKRWTTPLIREMKQLLQARIVNDFSGYGRVAKYQLFAIDGSRIDLPRTAAHEGVFSCSKKRAKAQRAKNRKGSKRKKRKLTNANVKKSERPAMWMTTLWHIGTGLPWDWRLGPTDSSERAHWMDMLKDLKQPAMFVGDAGFVGYEYAAAVLAANHHLLIRVGSHVTLLRDLGYVRESGDIVYLWPDKAAKRQGLPPLVFRLVTAHDGKSPIYLLTSVLSTRELSDNQVLEIYKKRWGIELFYRHLKRTFGKHKLRSASPDAAYVEMHWSILGFLCMAIYGIKKLIDSGQQPMQLSVAKLIYAFRRMMRDYLHPIEKNKCLTDLLRNATKDDYPRGDKTSREYPRKKTEKPPGAPKILIATHEQKQLVKQFKRMKLGLTA